MKKVLSIILAAILILSVAPMAMAATANVSVSASAAQVYSGEQVSFSVKITGDKLGSYQFTMSYDADALEYIGFSGNGDANGGAGAVVVVGDCGSEEGVASFSATLSFKAKKVSDAKVSLGGIKVVNYDLSTMTVSGSTSGGVKIVAKPEASTDNSLKSLTVSPSGLSPAFSADKTEYAMEVEYTTNRIVVSATPNHSKAKVRVNGSSSLSVGQNTVTVVVTAESGATKTYTIKVTRKASDFAGVSATIDGQTYDVAYDINPKNIPEGYTQGESTFGDRKIVSFTSPGGGLVIVRLVNSNNIGQWFTFDEATQTFNQFVSVNIPENRFVLLEMPTDIQIPEGFAQEATDVEIGGVATKAYASTNSDLAGFYATYAMDKNGTKGIYVYDSTQGTLQRYAAFTIVQVVAPTPEEKPTEEPKEEPDTNLMEENQMLKYALLAAAVLLLVGGIVLLVVLLRKPPEEIEEEEENARLEL